MKVTKKNKDVDYDPGARLCGHGDRTVRAHYLGGGLWVCFECLAKTLMRVPKS
jgi:hypothetical protein